MRRLLDWMRVGLVDLRGDLRRFGVLIACLVGTITRDEVEPLAQGIASWYQELTPAGATTCVFRDSAFADDVAKTNLAAIFEQHGIANVRSL